LLKQLDIEERFIYDVEKCKWETPNYSTINARMSVIRNKSLDYLKKILEG
jgi:hypothetical protein